MNFLPARLAAAAACTLVAAPAFAAPQAKAEAEPQTEAQSGDETAAKAGEAEPEANAEAEEAKRICRRIRVDMSSRRGTRVCMTADEWREFNQRR
jgi:hypothetical protein